MARKTIEERLALLGIDPDALTVLEELRPTLEEHADELAHAFYRHMLSFEEPRRLVSDPADRELFLESRRRYIVSLAESQLRENTFEETRRAALAHERSGLGPEWIIRFASLNVTMLAPLLARAFGHDPVKAQRIVAGLGVRLALDTEIAIEAYVERREESLAYMAEQLARESRQLQKDFYKQGLTLRQTTERAQAAEELASIATLVAGLAHEIGTPMSVIQGHAKMLEANVSGEDATWRLKTIQDQIARISRIIHTLLKMAHPRKWQHERVALAPLLEQSLSFVSEKLAAHGISVKQNLAPGAGAVGDLERLQQLFLNLFLNAADAMPEGGQLSVELAEVAGKVQVRISDTGIGIAGEHLGHIFEPFFTTKEAGHGNGLGLMVCKGIVTDHGGEIEVESELGAGTSFTITLPVREALGPLA